MSKLTMETDLSRSLTSLGITPYKGSAFDLRVDLNYRNVQRLPDDLFKLVELQWLNLNVNKLRDLPQGMSALKNLKWLYLENNCFDRFPTVLCELKDLMKLYFSSNTIRSLPIQVRQLTRLRLLDLSDNQLSEFPVELCTESLCNLEKLFLDNHGFTSLPAQISALKGLKLLWLNDNRLEWLPQSMCELVELEELQVKNNCLMYLPAYLTSRLSKLQTFEWKGCPLIDGVQNALEDGIYGLREYQRILNEEIEQENKVQFRSEKDGSWDRPCYRMRTRPRGVAIIIDNFCSIEWPSTEAASSRNSSRATEGNSGRQSGASDAGSDTTENDDSTDKLRNTLIKLGFNVRVMRGLMSLDIISALRFLSLEDHSYFDSLVVCILSHGTDRTIVGPDGIGVDIKQLTDIFSSENCPMLAHKPKLFFLQMLEDGGGKKNKKTSPRRSPTPTGDTPPTSPLPLHILLPDDPDFLLAFALVPSSAISESKQSKQSVYHFYVSVLFGMLEKFARKLNLLDVMTTVHSEIKRIRLSTDKASSVHITPRLQSTLKYNVYLSVHSSSAVKDSK